MSCVDCLRLRLAGSKSLPVAGLVLALMVIGVFGAPGASGHVQEATPAPGTGITTEVLGQGQPSDIPDKTLWLLRITFAPGAAAASHTHPGSTVFTVDSGSITFTVESGSVTLHRAGTLATPSAAEQMSAPTEFTLNAGDTIFYESDAVFSEVNEGTEPVVILVSNIRGSDEPARMPAATPAS